MKVYTKQLKRMKLCSENGFTLIEVLASIVLLSIIITLFFNIFIQSSKTTRISEEIIDATYLAQTEMELVYGKSSAYSYDERETALIDLGYEREERTAKWITFRKKIDTDYYAKLKLQKSAQEEMVNMNRLIVTIHKGSIDEKSLALMENIIVWEADSE